MFTHVMEHKAPHQHATVDEARVCSRGILPAAVRDPATDRQLSYLRDLGADEASLVGLGRKQASAMIDALKKGKPVTPIPSAVDERRIKRQNMVKGMLEEIPSGYFAVRPDDTVNYTFIRISRPKMKQYKDAIKVQTQHGPRLEVEFVVWPSGRVSQFRPGIVDDLMLVISDYQGAAMTYAEKIGKCCRCNAELTDHRSRFYGIGPECEQKVGWSWVIPMVEERKGAYTPPGH